MFGWNFEKVPPEKLPEGEEHWEITTKDHEGNNAVNGGFLILLVSHLLMSILPK